MVTQENSNFLVKQSHIRFAYQRLSVIDTEYAEWQRPLSSLHSNMMDKLAQAGEFGGCSAAPFSLSTITYKVAEYLVRSS